MIALVAGTISFSMAQGSGQRGTPEERLQRSLDRLKTTLTLNADQEAKVKVILVAQNKSQDSLRAAAGEGADRAAMFQKFGPIREASNNKIMALLNEDQKKAYSTYLETRSQGRQGGQGGGPRPAGQ